MQVDAGEEREREGERERERERGKFIDNRIDDWRSVSGRADFFSFLFYHCRAMIWRKVESAGLIWVEGPCFLKTER